MKTTTVFIYILFIVLNLFSSAFAQYYDSGQDPFGLKWRQIKTERFQLIYPQGIDSIAHNYLLKLETVAKYEKGTLTYKPQPIPVILHSTTIISNGEVGWAPKRMNLYLVAPQDNYFQPWDEQLTIHEFRHTVQLSKLNQNAMRWLNFALGEHATASIVGWHLPLWFLEGDAVAFETGASKAGRGRVPDFQMKLNAQVAAKGIYSYQKALFGSYRNFVPNHYELGYYLVAQGTTTYGDSLWNEAVNKITRLPLCPNPLSASLKAQTGLTEKEFYKKLLQTLADSLHKKHCYKQPLTKVHDYVNYYNPVRLNGSILVYKTSFTDIPAFVLIDSTGKTQKIFEPGSIFDNTFSATDSFLVWNEFRGTRWENENFSRIAVYNLKNNKLRYLAPKGRIFYSRLSTTGDTLLSVEVDEKLQWYITLRNIYDGSLLKQYSYDTLQPVQPAWSPNGNSVVFVAIGANGKSLGILNLLNGNTEWFLKNQPLEFSNPHWSKHGILLKATHNLTSNFFLYRPESNEWVLLTNVPYGVSEGCINNNTLLFSTYTPDGFRIDSLTFKSPGEFTTQNPEEFHSVLTNKLEKFENLIHFEHDSIPYPSKPYSKAAHLFNIHSWAPLAIRVESQEVGLGVTLLSQDVLSTSFLSIGFQNHRMETYNEFFLEYQYKGFYPVITTNYSLIPYSYYHPDRDTILRLVEENRHFLTHTWQIPFYFNRGKWYRLFQPEWAYSFAFYDMKPNNYFVERDKIHKASAGLFLYNIQKQSFRDLYPRWGQLYYINFSKVANGDYQGYQTALYTRLYFPGFVKNHSFRWYGGYQTQDYNGWPYYSKLLTPRGFTPIYSYKMVSMRSEYTLPILYPDLNVKELLYIKRIRLNLFHDFAYYNQRYEQQSFGMEMGFDIHALRLITPFDISFRYGYRIPEKTPFFEFNYSVNFDALYSKSVTKFNFDN